MKWITFMKLLQSYSPPILTLCLLDQVAPSSWRRRVYQVSFRRSKLKSKNTSNTVYLLTCKHLFFVNFRAFRGEHPLLYHLNICRTNSGKKNAAVCIPLL